MAKIFNDGDKVTKEWLNKVSVTNTDACCDATTPAELMTCLGAASAGDTVEEAPSNDKIYGRKNTQWVDIDPTGAALSHASTTGRDAVDSHPQAAITGLTTHVTTVTNHIGDDGIHFKLFSGTTDPDPALGEDGDLYIKEESNARAAMTSFELHAAGLGTEGERVVTVGCNNEGDGGGGTWYWDSTALESTANLGTIINPRVDFSVELQGSVASPGDEQSGCWVREYTGPIHAVWFGVSADATWDVAAWNGTDYTDALIAAEATAGRYGTLILPEGATLVTSFPITQYGIRLVGCGLPSRSDVQAHSYSGCSVLVSNNTTTAPFTLSDGVDASKHKEFYNLGFLGNTNAGVPVVDANKSTKTVYRGIHIYNEGAGDGIDLVDAWVTSFYDCFIEQGDANVRSGIGVNVTNTGLGGLYNFINTTLYQWQGNTVGEATVAPAGGVENFNFIGSQIKSCQNALTLQGGVTGATVIGSYIEGSVSRGITVEYGASGVVIEGNFFNNPKVTSKDIQVGRTGSDTFYGVVIEGNHFKGDYDDGEHIKVAAGTVPVGAVTVKSNSFNGAGASSAGIFVGGQPGVVVAENNYYASTLSSAITNAEWLANVANVETLSASKTLTVYDSAVQVLDTDGTGRTVFMPLEAAGNEVLMTRIWEISNVDTTAKNITLQTSVGGAIETIAPGASCRVVFDGTSFVAALY